MASMTRKSRPIKLSEREQELLDLLPPNGERKTTTELVEAFYGRSQPINARQIVNDRLRTIGVKLSANRALGFTLRKSKRRGPAPIEYWKVARNAG